MDTYGSDGSLSGLAFVLLIATAIGLHLFIGYCLKRIVEKMGDDEVVDLWWIPIVNVLLLLRAADKSGWWLVLLVVPGVNLIAGIYLWVETSKRLGKGVVPGVVAGLFGVGIPYLAFSDDEPVIAA
ncbi:MAG TPA: DUF5684 domain-containing protein [Candidatus Kapabacteria bacterium]|jgi:hypothetical protein|nr:DUF5684 domain-containing protein [Candidatus Kapabacteria bacterium]